MRKKLLKAVNKVFHNNLFKFIGYLALTLFILFIYSGILTTDGFSFETMGKKVFDALFSPETLSIFLAGIISIGLARFFRTLDSKLEETFKIADDHHAIIHKYNNHAKSTDSLAANTLDDVGSFMSITHIDKSKRAIPKNKVKDVYSKDFKKTEKDISFYKNGNLFLPTVNVFANINGNTDIVFNDSTEHFLLPDYLISNAEKLLAAHKTSNTYNEDTIRLYDLTASNNRLTLHTQRSTYFHMLITNRCMDYDFNESVTVRELYEYRDTISPLNQSKLGNQIGINGLILTSDGYVLVEKRDYQKTTWKNKFAQSISLALKLKDLEVNKNGELIGTIKGSAKNLAGIIRKTVTENFGLKEKDFEPIDLSESFLGLARDLLEGGKPNMYFYATTTHDAESLAEVLKKNAASTNKDDALKTSKLASDFYLIPFEDICIDYNYVMKINRRRCYYIRRNVYPRVSWLKSMAEYLKHNISIALKPKYRRECGEALLVTISYLEACKHRIKALNKEDK